MSKDAKCDLYHSCEFFIYEPLSENLKERFRKKYCNSLKDACARYMIYSAYKQDSSYIPKLLYPNEYGKALDIIEKS